MLTQPQAQPGSNPSVDDHTAYLLAAIVDSSFDAIISKNLDSIIQTWNAAAARMFGYTADEAVGKSVVMLIPPHLQSEEADIIERIRKGERVESFETVRLRKDGSKIDVSLTISPIRHADGNIVGASKIARDITQTREAERKIRLLLQEVNHRVKNQYAVILSIIRETSNRSQSPEHFERQLRDRILALARSQDLLVNTGWNGASLAELIEQQLGAFGNEHKVVTTGPSVTLNSNAVQHLGMAMHELGTNSVKYGVLGSGQGQIVIEWEISHRDGEDFVELTWNESTGGEISPVNPTVRRGFGSVVLERAVPFSLRGEAHVERGSDFIRWTLVAPLSELVSFRTSPALLQA
ncbi:MAG: PAS domain S-box protein [Devosia sp.]|uniref:sensor histidine kinase n=1 Tax=Devosia sp. TaxID=1871048 RepID=UPI0019DC40D3|nr:PAS domain S-box protein [Devosia sp.]MBF0679674.1 PAS domain S-box protein [Devosia sp.]